MAKTLGKTTNPKMGRPPLSTAEKYRRGTARPCRLPKAPATRSPTTTYATKSRTAPTDFSAVADAYTRDVLEGRIIACKWTQLACRRFRQMRLRADVTWAPTEVQRVCTFVERLPHVEGRWATPTITLAPWQVFILAAVYGFRRPDGSRLVTTVFFQVARKSAKSTLVAACALYLSLIHI